METNTQSQRAAIRAVMEPFTTPSNLRSAALVALDLFLYATGIWVVLAAQSMLAKMAVGCSLAIVISRCFILGHDACHRSLFTCTWLNRVLGRILFLPSLTPYSLWETGHNTVHHGYNNLKGRDQVWAPYSPREFVRLPRYRRVLEYIYRSLPGLGLYYAVELWWNKLFFPNRKHVGVRRSEYVADSALVLVYLGILLAVCASSAKSSSMAFANMLFAVALPLVLWNWIMGFTIYVHHTHPSVRWFQDRREWSFQRGVESTVHIVFPEWIDFLMHWIYQHPAHHSEVKIVSYRLRAAQSALSHQFPELSLTEPWSFREFRNTVRQCKLYDFDGHKWVPFDVH